MKRFFTTILVLAACAAAGFGTAKVIMAHKNSTQGYIGRSDIKIEDGKMTPEVLLSLGRLSDAQLSPDGSTILYGVSYTSIKDNRSCRNLFTCDTDGSNNCQLTKYAQSVSNARWSLDGKWIYFLQKGQMFKAPFKNGKLGKKVQISDIPAGIGEFKLSPDQSMVIYTSTVPGAVKTPKDSDPALDKAQAYVAEDLMYRHWDHWTTETPHSFIAQMDGSGITQANSIDILGEGSPFELPTEPFSGIEQLDWSPDGARIAYSCRKVTGKEYAFSTDTEIYIYDVASGQCTLIPMGGGYDTDPVWSPDGSRLAWLSMERNGYEADKTRLMVADIISDGNGEITAANIHDLTAFFRYNAAAPVWHGDVIYFNALSEGLQALYAASMDGSIEKLTMDDWWFDFNSPWAVIDEADGSTSLYASYESMEFPVELVRLSIGADEPSVDRITDENGHILSQLSEYKTEKRFVKTVDGKEMLTWVLFPPHFNPEKVYPSILITLGGPQGTLSQSWSYRWCYRLMAAQGYVVVLPNRRGTTAFGQEWTEQISGDYCGLNMQDYLCAARELKSEPYIGKMAACGASYGGYSVYYLAGVHKDVFDCFIAHAGIFDEKCMWYTTEEMWFPNWDNGGLGEGQEFSGIRQGGAPYSDLPKAQRHYANSPDINVTKWHTPILCIHGEKDFRIPYEQGMAAFNAAQMMGVPSKLVIFPEENHWIIQPQNALFWHRTYFDWLDKWTK